MLVDLMGDVSTEVPVSAAAGGGGARPGLSPLQSRPGATGSIQLRAYP